MRFDLGWGYDLGSKTENGSISQGELHVCIMVRSQQVDLNLKPEQSSATSSRCLHHRSWRR